MQKNNAYYNKLLFLDSNTFEELNTSVKWQYFRSAGYMPTPHILHVTLQCNFIPC